MNEKKKIINYDYSPLILISIYICLTYALYLIFQKPSGILSLIFMSIVGVSVVLGYLTPVKRWHQKKATMRKNIEKYDYNVNFIVNICSMIVILYSINFLLSYYDSLSDIFYYVQNPGRAYEYIKLLNKNPELNISGGGFGSLISIFLTLSTLSKYIVISFSIIYWKKFKLYTKIMIFISIVMYLIYALCIGSMITIGSMLISSIPALIYMNKLKFKNKLKILFVVISAIGGIYFLISNRIGSGSTFSDSILTIFFYVSHGYTGLEYALKLPFEFTYGFSTFRGISSYLVEIFGLHDFSQGSYLVRNQIQNGWPALSVWSTVFPWLASDISFYSIPILMFILAYILSVTWNNTLLTKSPYGFLLTGQFFIFWFMIPSNNQLFHTLENSVAFFTAVILYVFSEIKRKSREKID